MSRKQNVGLLVVVIAAALAASACGTTKWVNPNVVPGDGTFQRDAYECEKDATRNPNAGLLEMLDIRNRCMVARGWRMQ